MASGKSLARAGKMTGEDIGFADPFVAKKSGRPPWCWPSPDMPKAWSHLLYVTTALRVVAVACHAEHLKFASHHFIVYPFFRPKIRRRLPALHTLTLSPFPHGNHFAMHRPHSVSI